MRTTDTAPTEASSTDVLRDLESVTGVTAVRTMQHFDLRYGERWLNLRLYRRRPLDVGPDGGRAYKASILDAKRPTQRSAWSDWHRRPSEALAEALGRYLRGDAGPGPDRAVDGGSRYPL